MGMNKQRERQQAQRDAVVEHRRREDAAPRLRDEFERLLELRLTFDDIRVEGRTLVASYARPIVVATAPAHFEIHCLDSRCSGRHDLTHEIMRALRKSESCFTGTSKCEGFVDDEPCSRVLAYTCEASYSPGVRVR
jgi:hypothetical protein